MQALGGRHGQYVNDRYHRTGTLWRGGYDACPLRSDDHLLRGYRCQATADGAGIAMPGTLAHTAGFRARPDDGAGVKNVGIYLRR